MTAMPDRLIRYAVRPKSTIRGWYVWAVILGANGKERWAFLPKMTCKTKLEAVLKCAYLNRLTNGNDTALEGQ